MPLDYANPLKTPPTVEPVTLAELKSHLRITPTDTGQDDVLNRNIATARRQFELRTDQAVMSQVYELHLPSMADIIILPHPPLTSVDLVQYFNGTDFTDVDAGVYWPVPENFPGLLTKRRDQAWPVDQADTSIIYPWKITYTAGRATAELVPENIKAGVLMLAGYLYERRVTAEPGQIVEVPHAFESICAQYRVFAP